MKRKHILSVFTILILLSLSCGLLCDTAEQAGRQPTETPERDEASPTESALLAEETATAPSVQASPTAVPIESDATAGDSATGSTGSSMDEDLSIASWGESDSYRLEWTWRVESEEPQ